MGGRGGGISGGGAWCGRRAGVEAGQRAMGGLAARRWEAEQVERRPGGGISGGGTWCGWRAGVEAGRRAMGGGAARRWERFVLPL